MNSSPVARIDDVDGPRQRTVRARARLDTTHQRVEHRRCLDARKCAELLTAIPNQCRHRGNETGNVARLTVRRQRQLKALVSGDAFIQGFQFVQKPAAIARVHVITEIDRERVQTARLFDAVDPDFERVRDPRLLEMADEQREFLSVRVLHHVAMRGIAVEKNGSARPAQTGQRGDRRCRDLDPPVGFVRRCFCGIVLVDARESNR